MTVALSVGPPSRSSAALLRLARAVLPLVVVSLVAANSLDYVTPLRPGPDAGAYALGGMMLKEGRVLYTDVSTTKPPMIYVLNALALWLGDGGLHSIRSLERLFAIAGALLVYFIVRTVFHGRGLAVLTAVAFPFYAFRRRVFEQGNVTEEYAIVFVLAGVLCTVLAVRDRDRVSLLLSGLAGACFSCAALTKQPFVLSSVPWFLLLVLRSGGSWRAAAHRALTFSLGGFLPLGLFLAYLGLNGALAAWLETFGSAFDYVAHSRVHYVGTFERAVAELSSGVLFATRTGLIAFIGALGALAFPRFVKQHGYVPLVVWLAFALEFLGATVSKRFYGHYFLQVLPSFVLCLASGGGLLVHLWNRAVDRWRSERQHEAFEITRRAGHWIAPALIVLTLSLLDSAALRAYWQRLAQPFERAEVGRISQYVRVRAAPGDSLWAVPLANSRFNVETGLTPPPGFFLEPQWPTERTTLEEKLALLRAGGDGAPAWIVMTDDAFQSPFDRLLSAICDGYSKIDLVDQGYLCRAHLYVRNDRAWSDSDALGSEPDPICLALEDGRNQLATRVTRSARLIARGEFRQAIAVSEAALLLIEQSPGGSADLAAMAHTNLCYALGRLKRWEEAAQACRSAVDASPEMGEAQRTLDWLLAERSRAEASPE